MAVTRTLRAYIFERDDLRCAYCRRLCVVLSSPARQPPETATIDHVDPEGGDGPENLVTACKRCNSSKHRRTVAEWHDHIMRKWDWEETRL